MPTLTLDKDTAIVEVVGHTKHGLQYGFVTGKRHDNTQQFDADLKPGKVYEVTKIENGQMKTTYFQAEPGGTRSTLSLSRDEVLALFPSAP